MKAPSVFAIGSKSETEHHFNELSRLRPVQFVEPADALNRCRPGDLAIFYSEHFDRFRHCCVELKRQNVATLYMVDGILEWRNAWENRITEPACPWTMRTVLSHKVACIGPSQKRILDAWGNQGKTEIVGVPRFEKLRKDFATGNVPPPTTQGPFRLLVATAKTPGFTEEQVAVTAKSLLDLKDYFDSHTALPSNRPIEVIWRICGGLAERIGVKNQLSDLSGRELSEQLLNVNAVITTPSTTALESMLLERPVAFLDYHQTPKLLPTAWTITHAGHIDFVVNEMASPSPAKMAFQQMILRDSLNCDEDATQQLSRVIDEMLEQAAQSLAKNQPLGFAASILGQQAPYSNLDLEKLFPQFPEWGMDSPSQMAGELAQARREILHLQGELAQARNELAHAHRIFDEIHSHPIAGPIVRIRQRLVNLFRRSPETKPNNTLADPRIEISKLVR